MTTDEELVRAGCLEAEQEIKNLFYAPLAIEHAELLAAARVQFQRLIDSSALIMNGTYAAQPLVTDVTNTLTRLIEGYQTLILAHIERMKQPRMLYPMKGDLHA